MSEYTCDICGAPLQRSVVHDSVWLDCTNCCHSYYFGPLDQEDEEELALQLIEAYNFDVEVDGESDD